MSVPCAITTRPRSSSRRISLGPPYTFAAIQATAQLLVITTSLGGPIPTASGPGFLTAGSPDGTGVLERKFQNLRQRTSATYSWYWSLTGKPSLDGMLL